MARNPTTRAWGSGLISPKSMSRILHSISVSFLVEPQPEASNSSRLGKVFPKNHVEERWRFVVGVPLLKRNTKTQNSPLPFKTHPSGGKFHQLSPTWISLTQLELFRYVQRFQRPKKKTATAPGVGMMPCIKAAVPVGLPLRQAFLSKTPLSGPRFEGGSKTTYGHTPFRYTVD